MSAFGFGGTNFHAVLEEYVPTAGAVHEPPSKTWPSELFIVKSTSRAEHFKPLAWLGEQAKRLQGLQELKPSALKDLAHQFYLRNQEKSAAPARAGRNAAAEPANATKQESNYCLSIVATSVEDLHEKIGRAKSDLLDSNKKQIKDPRGNLLL